MYVYLNLHYFGISCTVRTGIVIILSVQLA